jgi:hypothetical protein
LRRPIPEKGLNAEDTEDLAEDRGEKIKALCSLFRRFEASFLNDLMNLLLKIRWVFPRLGPVDRLPAPPFGAGGKGATRVGMGQISLIMAAPGTSFGCVPTGGMSLEK